MKSISLGLMIIVTFFLFAGTAMAHRSCGEMMCGHGDDSDQMIVVSDEYSAELDSIKVKINDKYDEIRKARSNDETTLGQLKKLRAEMNEIRRDYQSLTGDVGDNHRCGMMHEGMRKGMMSEGMHEGMMNEGMHEGMMNEGMHEGMMNEGMHEGMMGEGVHKGMMGEGMHKGMMGEGMHKGMMGEGMHKGMMGEEMHEGMMSDEDLFSDEKDADKKD